MERHIRKTQREKTGFITRRVCSMVLTIIHICCRFQKEREKGRGSQKIFSLFLLTCIYVHMVAYTLRSTSTTCSPIQRGSWGLLRRRLSRLWIRISFWDRRALYKHVVHTRRPAGTYNTYPSDNPTDIGSTIFRSSLSIAALEHWEKISIHASKWFNCQSGSEYVVDQAAA